MSSDQSKAQLAEAKALIQQKRYVDARKVLKRIDDPIARQWEAKLDTLAPVAASASVPVLNYAIVGIVAGIVGLVIGLAVGNSLGSRSAAASIASIPTAAPSPSIESAAVPTAAPTSTVVACDPQTWWNEHQEIVARFLDTAETATSTSRISLSSVILEMRKAYRDFDALDYPDCVKEIYWDVRSAMSMAVDGYDAFMGQDDIMSSVNFNIASQYFYDAHQALLKAGAIGDYRMSNTSTFIWSGDKPDPLEATNDFKTRYPELANPALANFNATATAQAANPK